VPDLHQRNKLNLNRLAEEKWHKTFSKTASIAYKEMGLVSLSVVVFTQKNGQKVVEM
jgi:hypothetical protein